MGCRSNVQHSEVHLKQGLRLETEKLVRSWERHEAAWLRDYLVAGVEDPRLNIQSILSRHFLIRALVQNRFDALLQQECRFAAVMDWLLPVTSQGADPDVPAIILHALQKGSDSAEGLEIPRFVLNTFAALPAQANGFTIPNYLEAFLTRAQPAQNSTTLGNSVLNTFCAIWNLALVESNSGPAAFRFSLVEPGCGSANDYRFLHSYGIARFFDYTGFDLCQKNVDNAHALFPAVRFEQANVFAISAASKTFDFCLVHDLFEHLSLEGLEQAVLEVCRVTRRGICIGFFQMDEIRDHIIRPTEEYYWNLLSLARMKELFASNRFSAQAVHIDTLLQNRIGCQQTHNPNAYTFFLQPM